MVKNAVALLPPFTFNAIRFLMAAVVIGGLALLIHRFRPQTVQQGLMKGGIQIGVWLFAGYAFQTFGLMYTSSSKAGFITGLSIVLVPLFSVWLFRQKIRRQTSLGIVVATVGLFMLSFNRAEMVNGGDILVFFCAISFAMHIVTVGRYARQYPALLLGFVQILTAGILNAFAALIFEMANVEQVTRMQMLQTAMLPDVLSALLVTSLFATAFAFVAQSQFQKYTTATRTALIFSMEPVFAALTAYLWAGEVLSTKATMGALLILLGMILAELGSQDGKRETLQTSQY